VTTKILKEEITSGWRKLESEELDNLYSSKNVISVIKSRRIKRAGHKVPMGEVRNTYKFLVEMPEGKRLVEVLRVAGRIMFQ
jgi:hypothetical protein